jgi:hypothetical protein
MGMTEQIMRTPPRYGPAGQVRAEREPGSRHRSSTEERRFHPALPAGDGARAMPDPQPALLSRLARARPTGNVARLNAWRRPLVFVGAVAAAGWRRRVPTHRALGHLRRRSFNA